MKSLNLLTSTFLLTILLFSCKKDEPTEFCDPTLQFSAEEFVNQIESRLESQSIIGYQFAVNQGGNLYHDQSTGLARHENDPGGPVDIDASTRFNAASIAKFIATIALLNAMEDNNISLDYDFMDYLPLSWHDQADPGHQYTFRELLTHQTAINFLGSLPAGDVHTETQLLQALTDPPNAGRLGAYQNGNFNLVRVLIGEIVYNLELDSAGNYANSNICTDKYFEYIDLEIFQKLNLGAPVSAQSINNYYNSNYPYAYQYPFDSTFTNPADGSLGWRHSNNPYTTGGAAGLMLSALDIAKIMAFFKHDNSELIVSTASRDKILEFELGLFNSISGEHGRYQCKRGTRGPDDCCNRAIQSILMFFPNGVEAVILTNSRHNDMDNLLKDAYDASWIDPCKP
jgi:CubicO group peptidase (beta-lactamase class C family)